MVRSSSGRYLIATFSATVVIFAVAANGARAQNPAKVQCLETCDSQYNVCRNHSAAKNKCSSYRTQCMNKCYR